MVGVRFVPLGGVVPHQGAETLVHSVVVCLVVFGGSTKDWVFDNPKTVRISPIGVTPVVLHRYRAQVVVEYNETGRRSLLIGSYQAG